MACCDLPKDGMVLEQCLVVLEVLLKMLVEQTEVSVGSDDRWVLSIDVGN